MAQDIYADFSAFYDFYVGGWLDDLPIYLEFARAAEGPLLEIGAGTGRLTIPLARAGHAVDAVDVSYSMLDILRGKLAREPAAVRERVQIHEADVCRLALGRSFSLILMPFYAFNYLLTPARQEAALRRIHAHLAAGGRLLVDVFVPWWRIEECPPEPVLRREAVDPATGRKMRALVGYRMDLARRLEHRRHIFEFAAPDDGVERREFTTTRRYFLRDELEELFRAQGLAVEAVYGGYRREPAAESAEQMLYVLSRTG